MGSNTRRVVSNNAMGQRWLVRVGLLVLTLLVLGCGGRATDTGGTGSETSWLSMCSSDAECDEGECLCGVCTKVCEKNSQCGEVSDDASCTPASDVEACEGYKPKAPKLCVEPSMQSNGGSDETGDAGVGEGERDGGDNGGSEAPSSSDGDAGGATSPTEADNRPPLPTDPKQIKLSDIEVPLSPTDKVDLLFVIDNSISMADKQAILSAALPDLVDAITNPKCVDDNGDSVGQPPTASAPCPVGSSRQFQPISDMHIGVVTTSLGGYGAPHDCVANPDKQNSEQTVDMAHLLASLPRGQDSDAPDGFLAWTDTTDRDTFNVSFTDMVNAAGEFGCGWEASLESWYRFLVEPFPYTKVVRQNCPFGGDTRQSCIGPETNQDGLVLVDQVILDQRRQFLRPDSALGIIMLTDENDCSFRATGQSWRLAQALNDEGTGINSAFKAAAICETNPDDYCCQSCGAPPGAECPTATDDSGQTVSAGCENGTKYAIADPVNGIPSDDEINLRCFQQKQRFGVDYLYPVERYSNALSFPEICSFADDLDPEDPMCDPDQVNPAGPTTPNPIFSDLGYPDEVALDPSAVQQAPRDARLVFLTGIVGVPWQDLAQQKSDGSFVEPMTLRDPLSSDPNVAINWDWILGDRNAAIPNPQDPLMIEQVEPRSGTNPATGEAVAAPDSEALANSINGHEWNIVERDDLQYACTFELSVEDTCITPEEDINMRSQGLAVPACNCTYYGDDEYKNPLCQAEDGSYGLTQYRAKAYPGVRQLKVLHDMGERGVVASICPKETSDPVQADFGYRPAAEAILRQLGRILPR